MLFNWENSREKNMLSLLIRCVLFKIIHFALVQKQQVFDFGHEEEYSTNNSPD